MPSPRTLPLSTAGKLCLVVMSLLVLASAERFLRFVQSNDQVTGEAQWIWADVVSDREMASEASALYAIKDFRLERAPVSARLRIMVDEEYHVFLNGSRVGSGRFRGTGILDEYEVAPLLVSGENRLLIEARSRFRYGGVLAAIDTSDSAMEQDWLVVTDDSWKIVTGHEPGLLEGFTVPRAWHWARTWRRPPVGRWPVPRIGTSPAVIPDLRPRAPLPAAGIRPVEMRRTISASSGQPTPGAARGDVEDVDSVPGYLLDFGQVVEGHLELWAQGQQPRITRSLRRVRYEEQRPSLQLAERDEKDRFSDRTTAMIFVDQRPFWRDVETHRFRYALVSGGLPIVYAQVSREPTAP